MNKARLIRNRLTIVWDGISKLSLTSKKELLTRSRLRRYNLLSSINYQNEEYD